MDQDNRQGGGFDPSNPGAPGQFFFNAQQQPQQLFQNQFLQQQVGAGNPQTQISQTPQMLPA